MGIQNVVEVIMQLIKKLGTKKCSVSSNVVSYGLFLCFYCNEKVMRTLGSKKYKSCGCNRARLISKSKGGYGDSRSRLYKIWSDMKQRCFNTNNSFYKDYGGRGIKICNEWLEYTFFRKWALNTGYKDDLQIDRRDNECNYNPNNCRWVTNEINSQNSRRVKLSIKDIFEIREKYLSRKYTYKRLAKEYNIHHVYISSVIRKKTWKNI